MDRIKYSICYSRVLRYRFFRFLIFRYRQSKRYYFRKLLRGLSSPLFSVTEQNALVFLRLKTLEKNTLDTNLFYIVLIPLFKFLFQLSFILSSNFYLLQILIYFILYCYFPRKFQKIKVKIKKIIYRQVAYEK